MPISRLAALTAFLLLPVVAFADPQAVEDLKSQAGGAAVARSGEVAAPEGKPVDEGSELKVSLMECVGDQQARVEKAIRGAREKVDSCLAGLNPAMAAEIGRQYHKFKFYCAQDPSGAGGVTTHDVDGRNRLAAAHIRLTMRSRLIQYSMEARAFHEMIHAIDVPASNQAAKTGRDGKFIISASRHATPGFPDPVYGCQFACYGGIGEDEAKAMTRYSRLLAESGLEIPESEKDIPCGDANSYECLYVKKYARLCETGRPVATADIVEKDRAANRPACVAEGLANACDAADDAACASKKPPTGALCGLRCEILLETAANGGRMPGRTADRLFAIGAAVAGAIDGGGAGLEGENAAFYAAAERRGLIKACR